MPIIRDAAVVLARLDYSETSQVLVFFTRLHGKARAIGKGIRRGTKMRFAAGIDLLDVGELVMSSRQERGTALANVTEWTQTRSLSGLREKLHRLYGAEYAAELTAALTEDWDPHPELYDALLIALADLSQAQEPLAAIVAYQLDILSAIGLSPRFDLCLACGRATDLTHFSSHEGGMICRHCEGGRVEKRELSPVTLAALQGAHDGEISASARVGVFGVLNYHVAHLMGREPLLADKLVSVNRRRRVDEG